MSRPVTFDHKNIPHCTIAMPEARGEALSRIAAQLGCSRHELIQRFLTLALSVFDEGEG